MTVDLAIPGKGAPLLTGQAARLLFPLLFGFTCLCRLVPLLPGMPSAGLDPSWALGMNQALVQGLVLGRDIAFTFGPFASIATRIFHPATDGLMIWGALFFAVPFILGVVLQFRNSHWSMKAALLLWMAAQPSGFDPLFALQALLGGLYILGHDVEERPRDPRTIGCLLILLVPFGLAPLIKGNAIPIFGIVAALGCFHLLTRRNWTGAALVALAPPAYLIVFWSAADQKLADLPVYLTAMVPIILGYTEAMAVAGPWGEPALTLITLLLFVFSIYYSAGKSLNLKLMQILIVSFSVFIIWKEGFVRQDGHALHAGVFMAFAGLLIINMTGRGELIKTRILIALCSFSVLAMTLYYHQPSPLRNTAKNLMLTYTDAWDGLLMRLDATRPLERLFAINMAMIAKAEGLPLLPGTSDVYSYGQAGLITSGNQWNPRTVFQSYSAYTPELAEMNNAHLIGEGAPDNLFFQVQPIDGRYPSLEDGRSWPTILKNYTPAGLSAHHLILKRQATSPVLLPEPVARSRHKFGEVVNVPRDHGPLFVRIKFEKSLVGELANLLLKSAFLTISVTLDDGTVKGYRLVAGMTEAGFLLSPLVSSAKDFAHLYTDPAALDGNRVRSFTITPSGLPGAWVAQYDIAFVPLP